MLHRFLAPALTRARQRPVGQTSGWDRPRCGGLFINRSEVLFNLRVKPTEISPNDPCPEKISPHLYRLALASADIAAGNLRTSQNDTRGKIQNPRQNHSRRRWCAQQRQAKKLFGDEIPDGCFWQSSAAYGANAKGCVAGGQAAWPKHGAKKTGNDAHSRAIPQLGHQSINND